MTPTLLHLRVNLPRSDVVMDDNMLAPFQSYRSLCSLHIKALAPIRPYFGDLFDKTFGDWPAPETTTFKLEWIGRGYDMHYTTPLHLPATSCPKLRKLEILPPDPLENDVAVTYSEICSILLKEPTTTSQN